MISAKIIKDSINKLGQRITTFELEYNRFVHCFDEETEVLSQFNDETPLFRKFSAVKDLGLKVAQYDENTCSLSFVKPLNYIEKFGEYNMVEYAGNSKKFSMVTTDQHRVFTKKRTTNNEYINDTMLAKELVTPNWGARRIPQSGYLEQGQELTSEVIQLVAWFVADGHNPKGSSRAQFHFRKQRKADAVKKLLKLCEIDYVEKVYGSDVVINFDAPKWVYQSYTEDRERCYPDIATKMNQSTYELWKQALFESDGNVKNQEYNTYSKIVAEQVQSVAITHGDAVNLTCFKGCYKLTFQKTNYISFRYDKDKFNLHKRECKVYCVTVPSGYIMVRRSGKPYISGNCELMTHRVYSRNAASSRAIPIDKVIAMVEAEPAIPVEWGINQAGMQAKEVHRLPATCEWAWREGAKEAVKQAKVLKGLGLHKQLVNRVLEPYQYIKVIVTSTTFDNFFWLRNHADAQPEIKELAKLMLKEYRSSKPFLLKEGELHLPYVDCERDNVGTINYSIITNGDREYLTKEEAVRVSTSCCAQVSYRLLDQSQEKADKIYNQLVTMEPVHASPFEHVAIAPPDYSVDIAYYFIQEGEVEGFEGITSVGKDCFYSGNFKNWLQYRQLIKNNNCDDYEGWINGKRS